MADVPKTDRITFRLGPELCDALRQFTERYERSDSDVIREALWLYLESKGYKKPRAERRKKPKA